MSNTLMDAPMVHPLLTTPPFVWSSPEARELHRLLMSAYRSPMTAQALASSLPDFVATSVNWQQRVDLIWREFIEAAFNANKLPALLEAVCADPAFEAYHPPLRALLEHEGDPEPGEEASPELLGWEREYLVSRKGKWRFGRSDLLAPLSDTPLSRADLYVPLHAATEACWLEDDALKVVWECPPTDPRRGEGESAEEREAPSPAYLEQAIGHPLLRCVVVEGEAGSGKTVLMEHLAYTLARHHLEGKADEGCLVDVAALTCDRPLSPVPLLTTAAAVGARTCGGKRVGLGPVLDALAEEIADAITEEVPKQTLKDGFEAGRYMVLIDSLDEVAEHKQRVAVVECIEALAGFGTWRSRLVLTTRPMPFTGIHFGQGLRKINVASLDRKTARALMARWCAIREKDEAYLDKMEAAIRSAATGADFAENPMLLTCAMLIYSKHRRLPDDRATLYERMVDILCVARTQGLSEDVRREALEIVSEALQKAGGTVGEVEVVADSLIEWLSGDCPDLKRAEALLNALGNETGLVRFATEESDSGPPRRTLRLWHRTFQEFLCACRLAQAEGGVRSETDKFFVSKGDAPAVALNPAWEGVLRFLVGVYCNSGVRRARAYVERLHDHAFGRNGAAREPRTGRVLGLVAAGLAEYRQRLKGHRLLTDLPGEIVEAFEAEGQTWPVEDRLLVLDALGRLGDPRLVLDELWVEVVGGGFVMGADPKALNRAPSVKRVVGGGKMAWRPVTVADYKVFVETGGYKDERWWSEGGFGEFAFPSWWLGQVRGPNHPVMGVCWYEAAAFCKWATEAWGVDEGWKVDLPMEAEWEWVARAGDEGRDFPWGNEAPQHGGDPHANFDGINRRGAGRVTPVGTYARGNQGGFVDLGGNVWEWCRDRWRDTDDESWQDEDENCRVSDKSVDEDDKFVRVVRGGAWIDGSEHLRCAARSRLSPVRRFVGLGFRVVCVTASTCSKALSLDP